MPLKETLSRHWFTFQRELFPWLEEALGPLGERYQRLVRVLELVRVDSLYDLMDSAYEAPEIRTFPFNSVFAVG